MYKRILVPLDGSQLAEQALGQATQLCPQTGVIVLLQVVRLPLPVMTPDIGMTMPIVDIEDLLHESQSYLESLAAQLQDQGIQAEVSVVEGDNIADAIVEYAKNNQITLIVQSTHGRGGISRLVFGSVAENVLRKAPCPVLFIRASAS